ncbi:MAG: alginate export family protein [Bryobacterales bacterium]|nr:alginate export family protein [Bryobacterales bacterium]
MKTLFLLAVVATTALDAAPHVGDQQGPSRLLGRPISKFVSESTPKWLSLSGDFRFRFEDRRGLGFKSGSDDAYGLARPRIDVRISPSKWLNFGFQGQDSRAPGIRKGAHNNGVFRDTFDVRQAYMQIGGSEDSPVWATVGRQLLIYGDQRLIGALDWTNTSRTFDAAKLSVKAGPAEFDVFSASVVQNAPARRINQSAEGNNLHGAYGSLRKLPPKSTIEPYMLWPTTPSLLDELGLRGDLDRYTGGVRIFAKGIGPFDYNAAVVRQWGSVGAASISAWGAYAELGYTLRMPWTPRLYAEYTFGSGDADSTDGVAGGFADLLPTAHLWHGYNDMVGWRNLRNVRAGSQLKPIRKLSVRLDYHSSCPADKADGLYNVAERRTLTVPAAGATDAKIGDEVDATLTVPLTPTITVGGGLGYMFPGPFLKAHSPGSGNSFTFLFVGYKF